MMLFRSKYLLIILFTFIQFSGFGQNKQLSDYNPDIINNYIRISGETNINHFQLYQDLQRTINIHTKLMKEEDSFAVNSIIIPVSVKSFRTANNMVYRDFLELVKGHQYPFIFISIPQKEMEKILRKRNGASPEIKITLAGNEKAYEVNCQINSVSENSVFLRGMQEIKLTDFKLQPPVKSLGLIKVKNTVIITFGFNLII